MVRIVSAKPEDLSAIRRLHTESWRDAYAPFVPPEALERLDAHMAARWTDLPDGVLCAHDGDALVGFVRVKRRQGWPYIDNLHADPARRGGGIGGALMQHVAEWLAVRHEGRVWLTVIAGNTAARRFYRRHGGWEGAGMVEDVLGHPTATIPAIWNSLSPTAAKNQNGGVVRA